ncbi:MAG: DUF4238 domain-containing protein [Parasporobacterium sp.]|nr:DUF4238 domain-containing protein [Parasporobacterium sp.]
MSNSFTKKQHYIPQTYLRGFSPEYEKLNRSNVDKSKYTIWQYNIDINEQSKISVPIKSICRKNDLYELFDKDGNYINHNWLERVFGALEKMFSKYRKQLEEKAFIKENLSSRCFLTREERKFWSTYIILQYLRLPEILFMVENDALSGFGDEIKDFEIKNLARELCIPLFRELKEDSIELKVFNALYSPLTSMEFHIGVDGDCSLITSDKTIFASADGFPCNEYDELYFPITSSICLILLGGKNRNKMKDNTVFLLEEDIRDYINMCIAGNAFNTVYSNHRLSKEEKKLFRKSRTEN